MASLVFAASYALVTLRLLGPAPASVTIKFANVES
jgi:hypothetical protein